MISLSAFCPNTEHQTKDLECLFLLSQLFLWPFLLQTGWSISSKNLLHIRQFSTNFSEGFLQAGILNRLSVLPTVCSVAPIFIDRSISRFSGLNQRYLPPTESSSGIGTAAVSARILAIEEGLIFLYFTDSSYSLVSFQRTHYNAKKLCSFLCQTILSSCFFTGAKDLEFDSFYCRSCTLNRFTGATTRLAL